MKWGFIAVLLTFNSAASAENFVKITQGTGGALGETKLYVVDYDCGYDQSRLRRYTSDLYGPGIFLEIATNFGVELKSQNAAATPGTATSAVVFNPVVISYRVKPAWTEPIAKATCPGQFFISGAETYMLAGKTGNTDEKNLSQFVGTVAGAIITGASAVYPMVRLTKPPEFDNSVNRVKDLVQAFSDFQNAFKVDASGKVDPPKELKVGKNSVTAYDHSGTRVAWLTLTVTPVVGLVKSNKTKFLSAYQTAAAATAISLDGNDDDLRQRCQQTKQMYFSSGIRDDTDIGFLLYKRMLQASGATREKIVKCIDDRATALAALDLLNRKNSPIAAIEKLQIKQEDIDNFLPIQAASDQPHTRTKLADEIDIFLDALGRHLRGQGLIGGQLAHLLDAFLPNIVIEDRTTDYRALNLMLPGPPKDSADLIREDVLAKLRSGGIIRWLCAQRTKRDQPGATLRIYDPNIDSAVMVVAAKASANDELDFGKSTLFGVHVLFAPAKVTEPLHIKKLVFEERFRDNILKANPGCVKNAPS
ncbi:hypothetical protein RA307_11340 [Xanthobacteraceae bacterium Astr-EGSB]|uniref:hypothetical protein n=1 Tax=Astrobacterium formosum TaxID=3069710 RepID=UPI0027B7F2B4|nr:hypothetical protein [Xanthobacteraceae bacterium Astr-EGSB]